MDKLILPPKILDELIKICRRYGIKLDLEKIDIGRVNERIKSMIKRLNDLDLTFHYALRVFFNYENIDNVPPILRNRVRVIMDPIKTCLAYALCCDNTLYDNEKCKTLDSICETSLFINTLGNVRGEITLMLHKAFEKQLEEDYPKLFGE